MAISKAPIENSSPFRNYTTSGRLRKLILDCISMDKYHSYCNRVVLCQIRTCPKGQFFFQSIFYFFSDRLVQLELETGAYLMLSQPFDAHSQNAKRNKESTLVQISNCLSIRRRN